MPRSQAVIPVSKGIDQRLDERLRSADSLTVLRNAEYRRNDAVRKRHGFTALPTTMYETTATSPASQGTPKGLFSTGEELCVRGYRELYAYKEANGVSQPGSWWNRGELSPFTGQQRALFSDQRSVGSCDLCELEGYTASVQAVVNVQSNTTDVRTALVWNLEAKDGTIVHNKQELYVNANTASQYLDITGARLVASTALMFAGFQRPDLLAPGYGTLQWLYWNPSTFQTLPAAFRQHLDLYYPAFEGSYGRRFYDSCPGALGRWHYAYIRNTTPPVGGTTNVIAVYTMLGLVQTATVTISPPAGYDYWTNVAINYGATSSQVYILASAINAGTNATITELYALNETTLATIATTGVDTGTGATQAVVSLGVCEGVDHLSQTRVVSLVTRTAQNSLAVQGDFIRIRANNTALSASYSVQSLFNMHAVTKPWFRNGRAYCAAATYHSTQSGVGLNPETLIGYAAEAVIDLAISDPESLLATPPVYRWPRLVGRYSFGAANVDDSTSAMRRFGSLQSVYASGDTVNKYATTRITAHAPVAYGQLRACDEIALDYAGATTQQATTRGTATMGGGSVSWFAGNATEELGWCSAPVVAKGFDTTGGLLTNGVYSYCAAWEAYDEKGTLLRSLPGPVTQHNLTGMHNAVDLAVFSLGPTQRKDKRRWGVGVYRLGSDGVFRRCVEASRNVLDTQDTTFLPAIRDKGGAYDILYTQGGAELEAAGPDGASYVVTTSRRVWLAGFYQRDRVMYSKPYDPTTANEFALAPEFNDAFAFMLPGGEQVTGLGEMDDKVIIFTKSNIYAIAGNGPDDGGRGNDYSGLQLVSSDTGCVDARSIVSSPAGIFFQAPSGIFVLGRDLQIQFIGAPVRDITDLNSIITSAVLVPAANHVRFTCRDPNATQGTILCFDFDQGAWIEWTPKKTMFGVPIPLNPIGACLHKGVYYVLDALGTVFFEDDTAYKDDGTHYVPMEVQTSWLQAAQQSGWQRIRQIAALCKSLDPHALTISLYQEFSAVATQSFTWSAATVALQQLQELVEMRVKQQMCTAFKIAISDASDTGTLTGQGYELAGFTVELGGKRGLYKPGTQQRN
jgi:hypothetical protein